MAIARLRVPLDGQQQLMDPVKKFAVEGRLFEQWLLDHYPQRATHVLSLIRQSRGGELYDSRFGARMRGEGIFAELLAQRFAKAMRKLGLEGREGQMLDCSAFCPPGGQMALF